MTKSTQFWGPTDVEPGSEIERVLGSLRLRVRRLTDEVWIHGAHDDRASTRPEDWMRWSIPATDRLEWRPALPDRPVVVSPEQPFHLPPRGAAKVFVRVPLFVALRRIDDTGDATELVVFPTLVLSDTWWGTLVEGELAYWLTTKARRAAPPEIFEPHLAVCPLVLSNRAEESLHVDRFAVRVSHLTLFGREGAVWTDEVRVDYEGAPEGSEIRYTGRAPKDVEGVELLAPPREAPPRGLRARTFGRLRALSGL